MYTLNLLLQLLSAEFDIHMRIKAATWLHDSIQDYVSIPLYTELLEKLIPVLLNCLKEPAVFISTFPEQELRRCLLQILCQLSIGPPRPFEPYAKDVVDLLTDIVPVDNEKNALLCIKVIINTMGHQTKVNDLIHHMFDQIKLLKDQLDNQAPRNSIQQTIPKAMTSFKVLAECPNIARSMFQANRSLASPDIKDLFLPIKSVLLLQAKAQEQAHDTATAEKTIFAGVSPSISNTANFGEFIKTQVQTMSLFAYLLRHHEDELTKHTEFNEFLEVLPGILIRLLKDCPREKWDVRKELFVAFRSIINFNYRKIFVKLFDDLLNERILFSDGLTAGTLRPLAYCMIADLINHVKESLESFQIQKIVEVYTRNLQNSFISLEGSSAKVLLIVAKCTAKMPNKADARYCLITILKAIGNKLATMNQQYPKLHAQASSDASSNSYLADNERLSDWHMPIKSSLQPLRTDPVADNKLLFKLILTNLDDVFDELKAYCVGPIGQTNAQREDTPYRFTAEALQVISNVLCEVVNFFWYYYQKQATKSQYTSPFDLIADRYISSTEEEKPLLKTFVSVLLSMDQTTLHEIYRDEIPAALRRVPQLAKMFPTLIQQHKHMNAFKELFDIHASNWFTELPIKMIIDAILDIEEAVYGTQNRIFRATINKYLNRFAKEFCSFLLRNIEEPKYGRFLAQTLGLPENEPFRKVVGENIEMLTKISEKDTQTLISSIHIMHSLCQFEGNSVWMEKENLIWFKRVRKTLEAHVPPPHLRLTAEQASEQGIVIFAKFLECLRPTDMDSLLGLAKSMATNDLPQTHPMRTYIYRTICKNSIEFRKTIVMQSMEIYASQSASQNTKTSLIHNIVNPIILETSKQESPDGAHLVDKAMTKSIRTKIWKASLDSPDDDSTQLGIDHTRMEALQLTAILVKYYHTILHDMWPDIIEFCSNYISHEDTFIKHAAQVVLGYCVAHHEVPVEIILQVYISLLESNHDEAHALVMQALQLIVPVLPNLCNAVPDDRTPIWAAIPRRILTEERRKTAVFGFLVNNPDLFYEYRGEYIIHIMKSLRTIVPSIENKKLILPLMTLVWLWERRRVEGKKCNASDEQLVTSPALSMTRSTSADKSEYKITCEVRNEMLNYLAEFIIKNHPIESVERINSLSLLHNLVRPQYWGDLTLSNTIQKLTGRTLEHS